MGRQMKDCFAVSYGLETQGWEGGNQTPQLLLFPAPDMERHL